MESRESSESIESIRSIRSTTPHWSLLTQAARKSARSHAQSKMAAPWHAPSRRLGGTPSPHLRPAEPVGRRGFCPVLILVPIVVGLHPRRDRRR